MILFKKIMQLNKEIKVGKRIDFHNSILFFEEDFYRPIKFLTFERDNYGYNSLKRKWHQKSSARNSILISKKDLTDMIPPAHSIKRKSTLGSTNKFKFSNQTNIDIIDSSMFVNSDSPSRLASTNLNNQTSMRQNINSNVNLNNNEKYLA